MTRKNTLFDEFKRFVGNHRLIDRGGRVLAAVSGGVDSVVMLDLLSSLRSEWDIELDIVHVNHGLRGAESDEDEQYVRDLARKYGCDVFVKRVATRSASKKRKISLQDAARNLRYAFFLKTLLTRRYNVIATGHNANDNAETLLLKLFRGTGIRGLTGIPLRNYNGEVVRPLLFAQRSEIVRYAKDRKLSFREDSSNASEKYARNYLRRKIIPDVERRINPSLVATLNTTAAILRESEDFIAQETALARSEIVRKNVDRVSIDMERLSHVHPYLGQMILHDAMLEIGIEPTFERITAILNLSKKDRGARVECGKGWIAEKGTNEIILEAGRREKKFSRTLRTAGTLAYDGFSISVEKCLQFPRRFIRHSVREEYVDGGKLHFPLTIRSWKEGDAFIPLGMRSFKKLSDFFVDEKIPRVRKHSTPIVANGADIVWVAGVRLDERYKITETTKYAYKLTMTTRLNNR